MEHEVIIFREFESASGLTRTEILELVDYGVFSPVGAESAPPARPDEWQFPDSALTLARLAARLRDDFDAAPASLALLFAYRERLFELERRVRELECRLPR